MNPIYESGDDEDMYEELPEMAGDKTYSEVAPPLPSARYDHLPPPPNVTVTGEKEPNTHSLSATPKHDPNGKLALPSSNSSGALSTHSAPEDCYTVMNPAGTITVVPRNSRHSGVGVQWGAPPAGE